MKASCFACIEIVGVSMRVKRRLHLPRLTQLRCALHILTQAPNRCKRWKHIKNHLGKTLPSGPGGNDCKSQVTLWAPRPPATSNRRHLCKSFTTTSYGEAIVRSQKDCLETRGPNSFAALQCPMRKPMEPSGTMRKLKKCKLLLPRLRTCILWQTCHS